MAIEIERKFLVTSDDWRAAVERSAVYRQAYIASSARVSVRVRIVGERANLNIKSAVPGIRRAEFEYAVPLDEARQLLELRSGAVVEKTRFFVRHGGHLWEVDVFAGANAGLVVAEIELGSSEESFSRPAWLGAEVSQDKRYYNARLAAHPFSEWSLKPGRDGS